MTDLQSTLGLRITGRQAKEVLLVGERVLREEDLAALAENRESRPAPISRLRERHHSLARILASGEMSDTEAGLITGYDPSRIAILRADPTFQELVAFYRDRVTERYFDMHEKLADLGEMAVDELSARLEADPSEFTVPALLEVGKFAADRSGHGPSSSTQVDVRVGLADKLEAARQRALEIRGTARDITPKE